MNNVLYETLIKRNIKELTIAWTIVMLDAFSWYVQTRLI